MNSLQNIPAKIKAVLLLLLLQYAVHLTGNAVLPVQKKEAFSNDSSLIRTGLFYSPSVQLNLKYTAILPAGYNRNRSRRYPVIYLLHGHTGNYTSWLTYAKLPAALASQYNCIIILPDAGNSWYVNWSRQTDGKPHRWEDMLIKDLVPHVDSNLRTITDKKGRAIGGLSMGGFGALAVGLKNNDVFGFVFSSAGAINFCKNIKSEMARYTLDWNSPQLWSDGTKRIDVKNFSTQKERTPQGLVFKTTADADVYDPYLLLKKCSATSLSFIAIDCGTRDNFSSDAFQFAEELRTKTDRYSFITFPGEHEVPYWEQSIMYTFSILHQNGLFNKNADAYSSTGKIR